MTILRDILDITRDISNSSVENVLKKKRYSSLSKRSLEGTLQFPILVSKSMDIDTLQMITKGLERQYASFVQVALTMSPTLDLKKDQDAIGYLKRFHQNTNIKTDLNDVMNFGVDVLRENYEGYVGENQQQLLFAAIYEGSTPRLIASNKEQMESILEHVRQDVLNNKFVPKSPLYQFKNEGLTHYHNQIAMEKTSPRLRHSRRGTATVNTTDPQAEPQPAQQAPSSSVTGNVYGGPNTTNNYYNNTPTPAPRKPSMKDMDVNIVANDILKNNDVQKANELVPVTLHIRTILMSPEGEQQGFMDFVIGIKGTMHPIASEEMVTNMVNACKSNNKFFNFVRWTTGETSFFKDFLLNIKGIKDDVVNRSAGASPWWITLKRRRALAQMKNNLRLGNNILPNSTIVLSMEEVNFIKTEFGYDLMNPSFVDKIMKEYFLLGFAVVDNSTQIAHFYFDGQGDFQSVTFSGLERENRSGADIKEVLKLVNGNRI